MFKCFRYVTFPAEGVEWWKTSDVVEMNGSDDSTRPAMAADPSEDSNSPTSEDNPTPDSETPASADPIELMEEDDMRGPPKLFALNIVNSYGNSMLFELTNDGNQLNLKCKFCKHGVVVSAVIICAFVSAMSYLALDWHPKAKELFYNEKAADEIAQNDSYHAKPSQKKQVVKLEECLELYTTKEKLGEDDAW